MYYPSSENKGVISFAVTAKLICVFVFAYADCWFSHEAAQMEKRARYNSQVTTDIMLQNGCHLVAETKGYSPDEGLVPKILNRVKNYTSVHDLFPPEY